MASGIVFDVQRFSVHDGPGLRTTVFLKGCPLRCSWCQNPESWRPYPEMAFFADRCRSSAECRGACPLGAIRPGSDRLDRERCDACGRCTSACAYGALQRVGTERGADELVDELARDLPFFESSGGGVTLSGGEPGMQPAFALEVASRCRERGISVGLQTCGAASPDALSRLASVAAFVHFDLKLLDAVEHRWWTGSDNAIILSNARSLCAQEAPVSFRMPVVPGVTDSVANLVSAARLLHEVGRPRLHLLAYHSLGEAKRARLGMRTPPMSLRVTLAQADDAVLRAAERLAGGGVEVTR